jgi:hypothetical protein
MYGGSSRAQMTLMDNEGVMKGLGEHSLPCSRLCTSDQIKASTWVRIYFTGPEKIYRVTTFCEQ